MMPIPNVVVAAPESAAIDVLIAVLYRCYLSSLVESLSTMRADIIHSGSIFARVAHRNQVVMHTADEPSALCALYPVFPCAYERLVAMAVGMQ
jgi:hypothetical protein